MRGPARAPAGWVSAAFLTSTALTAGFVAAYITTDSPQLEGLLLGLALAALAAGLVLWAMHLLPSGTYVEERPPMAPPEEDDDAFQDDLHRGGQETPGILRRTLGLAVLGLGAAAVVPLRGLLPGSLGPSTALRRTAWGRGVRMMTSEGKPVRADDLEPGTALTVFPQAPEPEDDATAVLIRLRPADLEAASSGAAGSAGLVAYSKLCTHAGCPVGLYEQTTRQLFCPCHQSVFDVLDRARPIAGPAARRLPQLPVSVDAEGYVQADGGFDGQVGPTYWRRG